MSHKGIDLEQAMKDGASIFQMPAAESPDAGAPPAPGAQPGVKAGEQPPQAPGEKPAAQVGEHPPAPGEKTDVKAGEQPPEHRFKTHEEAEIGYREVQSRATKAEQQNADLRKELEAFKTDQNKREQENRQVEIRDFAVAKNKEALAAINKLDPESPLHDAQVAEIWADAHLATESFRQSKLVEQLPSSAGEPPPADDDAASLDAVSLMLQNKNTGFGDEEQAVFWGFARKAPTHDADGQKLDLEQQVNLTIEKTKQFFANQRSRLLQEFELPLDRGESYTGPAPGASPSGSVKPLSLDEAMEAADQVRTLA